MLFAGIVLFAVGYTLVYAGVKGDGYQITVGGQTVPGWRQPWLPFVAVFSRSSAITFHEKPANPAAFYSSAAAAAAATPDSAAAAGAGAAAAGGAAGVVVPPSQAGGAAGAPPANLPNPMGGVYA